MACFSFLLLLFSLEVVNGSLCVLESGEFYKHCQATDTPGYPRNCFCMAGYCRDCIYASEDGPEYCTNGCSGGSSSASPECLQDNMQGCQMSCSNCAYVKSKCPKFCDAQGFVFGDCECEEEGEPKWRCHAKKGWRLPTPITCSQPDCQCSTPGADDEAFIREWNDVNMGVGFSMVSENGWRSGNWGVVPNPPSEYTGYLQTFISIMTRNQPMGVYQNRPYGLALHVTRESNFWKDFQVIGHGRDQLVGGPGDGGSHTPGTRDWRLSMESQGKDYDWFTSQKNGILARYNTVYHNNDYNEFITNGVRTSALAGVLMWERSSRWEQQKTSDSDLCYFLNKNAPDRRTPWPIYGYSYGQLRIIRHLPCGGLFTNETIQV